MNIEKGFGINSTGFERLRSEILKKMNINPYNLTCNQRVTGETKRVAESILQKKNKNLKKNYSQEEIDKIKRELEKYNVSTEAMKGLGKCVSDIRREKNGLGMMQFDFGAGNNTYKNEYNLIIGASKSGKSYLCNSLVLELEQSFDTVVFVMNKASWENICPQTLRVIIEKIPGMKYQWIDSDSERPITFADPNKKFEDIELFPNGSAKEIYSNRFPSLFILDDLYNYPVSHWVTKLIEELAVKGRHRKINAFVLYQGFTRVSSKILDNATKIFIFHGMLGREDLWPKLKRPVPENLKEVLADPEPARFYFLDSDNVLIPYIPLAYSNKKQIIKKMAGRLPIGAAVESKKKDYLEKVKIIEEFEAEGKGEGEGTEGSKGFKVDDTVKQKIKDKNKVKDSEIIENERVVRKTTGNAFKRNPQIDFIKSHTGRI